MGLELDRAIARGDQFADDFTGEIRPVDLNLLEEGDVFTIPDDFTGKVGTTKIGGNPAEYIFVTTKKGKTVQFFPSSMSKRVRLYDKDGKATDTFVTAGGKACELYRSKGGKKEGMGLLKGKTLQVTKVDVVKTISYGREKDAQVLTLDIINA